MTDHLCIDCQYFDTSTDHIRRCRSPQLVAMKTPGIPCYFERDEYPEEGRSHAAGTGKCGPQAVNMELRAI